MANQLFYNGFHRLCSSTNTISTGALYSLTVAQGVMMKLEGLHNYSMYGPFIWQVLAEGP